MLNGLRDVIGSSAGLQLATDVAVRSAVLFVIAALVMLGLRRASAAARHLGWAVAVTAVLLLPIISLLTPDWHVLPRLPGSEPSWSSATERPEPVAPFEMAAGAIARQPWSAADSRTSVSTSGPSVSEPRMHLRADQVLVFGWLSGVLFSFVAIALGFVRVAYLARRSGRITDGALLGRIAEVAAQLNVGSVLALEASDGAMPMTWGVLKPKLLLPASARNWSLPKLQAVLRHELAHVRRRDSLWQLLAELACALHWYNPLAWYAARRMRVEREHACDDEVLNAGSRASDYASELLEIARSLRSSRATSLAAIAMAQPSQLEGRLLAVLDEKRARTMLKRKWPAWFAAVVIVGPVAGASPKLPRDKGPKEWAPPTAASVAFAQPLASAPATARQKVVTPPADQDQSPCATERNGNLSIHSSSDDDRQDVKWEAGGCKGRMQIRGTVRIRGDLTGLESLSNGGDFRLWVNDGRDIRVVTVKPNGGSLVHEYTLNGDKRPWNTEGRAWFASILTYVMRSTGFAADERVDYLLKQQGVNGVLAEVESMNSDYIQRLYLQKLLNKTQLNGSALATVLATAKRALESDYEMAELLIAVANKYEFTEAVRRAFIDATATLQSDYEHRRALSAVLNKGGLSSENVAAMLASSQAIGSAYEKAELLLGIAARYRLDPAMRAAYLSSARMLHSDYEKGRVYKTLLQQGAVSGAEAADVLEAVGTMSSDYERAEVLRLISASALSNGQVQQAYLKVIGEMGSDYEMRRSLTALMATGRLTAGALDMMLNAALKIDSEYERAEFLLAVVRRYTLTPEQRNLVIKAADDLKSEHERGRVSSALLRQLAAPPPPPPRD